MGIRKLCAARRVGVPLSCTYTTPLRCVAGLMRPSEPAAAAPRELELEAGGGDAAEGLRGDVLCSCARSESCGLNSRAATGDFVRRGRARCLDGA